MAPSRPKTPDLAAEVADARARANATRDPGDIAAADALDAKLAAAGRRPDWRRPTEAVDKATLIGQAWGDHGPDDEDAGGWANLLRLIGMPAQELSSIGRDKRGVWWQVAGSGVWYVAVGADDPADADGKRGIMLLARPLNYRGPFPVYATEPTVPTESAAGSPIRPPSGVPPR